MSRCDPAFVDVITRVFSLDVLDRHGSSVVGLSADDRIVYVNPLWDAYAADNGGQPGIEVTWGLGARYLDAVPAPLKAFYTALLARARAERAWGRPIGHEYECSSGTLYRRYSMQVYGLDDGGLLIVNSLLVERPFVPGERLAMPPDVGEYLADDGFIHQCSHCRRIRTRRHPLRWDWVPRWVDESPEKVSHGLCEICLDYYYPAT